MPHPGPVPPVADSPTGVSCLWLCFSTGRVRSVGGVGGKSDDAPDEESIGAGAAAAGGTAGRRMVAPALRSALKIANFWCDLYVVIRQRRGGGDGGEAVMAVKHGGEAWRKWHGDGSTLASAVLPSRTWR